MKGFTNSLAILALLAGALIVAAPAFDRTGNSATAAQGGVTVTAYVRGPADPPRLPLTNWQVSARGFVIAVSWTNPPTPHSGALVEWETDQVRQGTAEYRSWHEYETHYPPANWAHLSAPMGARYTVRGAAYYDGGTTMSPSGAASVVVTAPVEILSSLPATGYAASTALLDRYGRTTYERRFETQLHVPGGAENLSIESHPISWSPQLIAKPTTRVYRLKTKVTRRPDRSLATRYYWSQVPIQALSPAERHYRSRARGGVTYADGYPSVSRYPFTWTAPGTYKVVMQGEFVEGFTHQGERRWETTRYISLAPTEFTAKLTTPKVGSLPRHTKKTKFSGTLSPARAAKISVSIQRRLHGKWRSYKNVTVKSKATGTWSMRTLVKKTGTFRVRTSVASGIVNPTHEYTAATSRWRSFKVR